jgi:hypothetical protein
MMDTSQIEQKLRRVFPELDIHVTQFKDGQCIYHFGSNPTMEEKRAVNQKVREYVREMEEKKELIELLADKEHDVCDAYSIIDTDGFDRNKGVLIPPELVERWERQLDTPYADLSEQEKQSDRDEVAHILPIIEKYKDGSIPSIREQQLSLLNQAALVKMVARIEQQVRRLNTEIFSNGIATGGLDGSPVRTRQTLRGRVDRLSEVSGLSLLDQPWFLEE